MSIYEVLGREQGIRAAVDEFYTRVQADPQLAHHFSGVDMARLRQHQVRLLIQVTGGPQNYDGRSLTSAHQHLGITSADFDRVVAHLGATLVDLGVDETTCSQVAAALSCHRDEIVAAPAAAGSQQ
ncbi:MAG: group I truncated hemoglobin [Candidatus Limnocylindria bacterium]|jgi:hemoglobin